MKVCDVVLDSVWYDPRVVKQIQEYKANNIDLSVVGIEDNRIDYDEINKMECNVTIVNHRSFHGNKSGILTKLKHTYLLYRDLTLAIINTRPNIIHANDLNALLPSYIASRKIGAKVIYDTHEIFLENIGIYSSRILKLFWSILERYFIKRVDLVVCVSNAAAEYLSQKYLIKNTMVITNCCRRVNPELIKQVVKNPGFEILNHGQFYEGRGYDLMVEAAKLTNNNQIVYSLRGFGKMENTLKEYVLSNKLNNVRFYSPVKVTELISNAAKSKVGLAITIPLCLNFKLSISNKIFEYAAAGLPVIMSNIPEHIYLNDKYNFGIVLKTNSPEELHKAVMTLYNDKNLYEKLSNNALIMATEMNWEKEFAKLLDFERNLL